MPFKDSFPACFRNHKNGGVRGTLAITLTEWGTKNAQEDFTTHIEKACGGKLKLRVTLCGGLKKLAAEGKFNERWGNTQKDDDMDACLVYMNGIECARMFVDSPHGVFMAFPNPVWAVADFTAPEDLPYLTFEDYHAMALDNIRTHNSVRLTYLSQIFGDDKLFQTSLVQVTGDYFVPGPTFELCDPRQWVALFSSGETATTVSNTVEQYLNRLHRNAVYSERCSEPDLANIVAASKALVCMVASLSHYPINIIEPLVTQMNLNCAFVSGMPTAKLSKIESYKEAFPTEKGHMGATIAHAQQVREAAEKAKKQKDHRGGSGGRGGSGYGRGRGIYGRGFVAHSGFGSSQPAGYLQPPMGNPAGGGRGRGF